MNAKPYPESKRMTDRQAAYIHALAAERGLRWAKPFNPMYTHKAVASALIDELKNRFSLTHGLFVRDYVRTGIFEIVNETKAGQF